MPHHILRVDNDKTHTYCWKIKIRRRDRVIYKYFTDALYGGKAKALKAAKAYRDALMKKISGADYAMWRRTKMRPNNTSGVVGVGRYIKSEKTGRSLLEYPLWEAYWVDADGKRRSKRFLVHQFGERKAKRLAREIRVEKMEEVRRELLRRGKIFGAPEREK